MTDMLPKEVRAGLEEARKRDLKRRSRLRVMVGDEIYPILKFWETGFALDADQVQHLRGLVDIYDGTRHLYQSLIIASDVEEGDLICTMKRSTIAHDSVPLDYVRESDAPAEVSTFSRKFCSSFCSNFICWFTDSTSSCISFFSACSFSDSFCTFPMSAFKRS